MPPWLSEPIRIMLGTYAVQAQTYVMDKLNVPVHESDDSLGAYAVQPQTYVTHKLNVPVRKFEEAPALKLLRDERNKALARIEAFEFRAGCALENIPVEALGKAQDASVNQHAIDTLKAENADLSKRLNAAVSETVEYRGRWKEVLRELDELRQQRPSLGPG